MKGIKHECQLLERCDVRECWKVRQLSGGVTVFREM